ncbi:TetR/AcrR family transcriptional regulator [Phenylobacterium deserti]|uniref:TetR/AcrR family transcriptional regulator n=1 Tax=Phenylobacterium deserti TaxID=1914756 RepID=A0A328AC23_9CAUL|nr:TetR/AcrR family transcriptional regulator [Phenylobacterium deserti]RAK52211.1 TetR/AcrR family transcriptional regulator [Phenylobacterium deserti]
MSTADKLIGEAGRLIVNAGYNGFSYAHLAERLGIRKASIHHHFPSKVDLVVAVVEQQRTVIRQQIAALENDEPDAMAQLLAYVDYWKRCIEDQSEPFCLAGVLAVELPALPEDVGVAVRGHFNDLGEWLKRVMALGVRQGAIQLELEPETSAQFFQTAIYGAMVMARAYDDPGKFNFVVDAFLARMRTDRS